MEYVLILYSIPYLPLANYSINFYNIKHNGNKCKSKNINLK